MYRLTEHEIKAIPVPLATETWKPISHGRLIDVLELSCNKLGIGVVSRDYDTGRDGARMFGLWTLEQWTVGNGRGFQLGFRNSLDKSMAIGVCAGLRVIVCSNMVISGEYMEFRKHTSGLDDDELTAISLNAVRSAAHKIADLKKWHDTLRAIHIDDNDKKLLAYDSIAQGVFSGSQFNNFLACYAEEFYQNKEDGWPSTLYTFHGACTRLMRGWNLLRAAESNRVLNGICNNFTLERR